MPTSHPYIWVTLIVDPYDTPFLNPTLRPTPHYHSLTSLTYSPIHPFLITSLHLSPLSLLSSMADGSCPSDVYLWELLGITPRLSLDSDNPLRGSTHPVHDLLAHPIPMCRYFLFRKLLPLLETPLAHSLDPWITSYLWSSQPCGYLVSFGYRGNFPSTLHSGYLSGPM